jgi:ADP-heptose:LPS heptosyltransferase
LASISLDAFDRALDLDPDVALQASRYLFQRVIEPLADAFDPALCDVYARFFSEALPRALPELNSSDLLARYRRVRTVRLCRSEPRKVFVLSRVTLGADVAVTSVILDAIKVRFPEALICLVGPLKCWELFSADPRIHHMEASYPRNARLRDRLAIWPDLHRAVNEPDSVLVDPDSRLTQLGLLPIGSSDENYYLFESRAYGGDSCDPLPVLTRRWVAEVFGVDSALPYIAPARHTESADITISFGVGENPAKRLPDPFESDLLGRLVARGASILIDRGAGGEEAERVSRALETCGHAPGQVRVWDGAFAPFAAAISRSGCFIGYDSAGQHVAAACGVPLVSVFAGFPSERMFARWRPWGAGPIEILRVDEPSASDWVDKTLVALGRIA